MDVTWIDVILMGVSLPPSSCPSYSKYLTYAIIIKPEDISTVFGISLDYATVV